MIPTLNTYHMVEFKLLHLVSFMPQNTSKLTSKLLWASPSSFDPLMVREDLRFISGANVNPKIKITKMYREIGNAECTLHHWGLECFLSVRDSLMRVCLRMSASCHLVRVRVLKRWASLFTKKGNYKLHAIPQLVWYAPVHVSRRGGSATKMTTRG